MRTVRQLPRKLPCAVGMQLGLVLLMSLFCAGCVESTTLPDSQTLGFSVDVRCRHDGLTIVSTVTNKTNRAIQVKDADLPWAKPGPGLYWLTAVDDLASTVQQQKGIRNPLAKTFVLSAGSSISEVANFYDVFDSPAIRRDLSYFFSASYRTPADHKASSLGFMVSPCSDTPKTP